MAHEESHVRACVTTARLGAAQSSRKLWWVLSSFVNGLQQQEGRIAPSVLSCVACGSLHAYRDMEW
jgi:hypothetical protein